LSPATPKRSFPQKYVFSLPSIEQNFYFVQFGIDFKMPLSIGSFIENRRTADQRHVRCASRSKDQSLRSCVSRLNRRQRSQIRAAEFFPVF
jgi:hypothetical protein